MRTIAGAIVVLAGAVLWGAGSVAVTLAPGMHSFRSPGEVASYAGALVGLIGFVILSLDLWPARQEPPSPGGRPHGP